MLRLGRDFPVLQKLSADDCFDLGHKPVPAAAFAAHPGGLFPELTTFAANASHHFSAGWAEVLAGKQKPLQVLHLSCTGVSIESVLRVANYPALKVLEFAANDLNNGEFQTLYNPFRQSLERLFLQRNYLITGPLVVDEESEPNFPHPVELDLSLTQFSEEGVIQVVSLSPKLETFQLGKSFSIMNTDLLRDPIQCARNKLASRSPRF